MDLTKIKKPEKPGKDEVTITREKFDELAVAVLVDMVRGMEKTYATPEVLTAFSEIAGKALAEMSNTFLEVSGNE